MAERLIDAEAFKKDMLEYVFPISTYGLRDAADAYADAYYRIVALLENAPTIDAKPVVHAHWNDDGRCTNCGEHAPWIPFCDDWFESAYCNGCGAQMDEGVKERE